MEQDSNTCPSCGATAPEHSTCPYCSWTPKHTADPISKESPAPTENASVEAKEGDGFQSDSGEPARLSELLDPREDPDPLLDQVPEELRGVLAARLKAAADPDSSGLGEDTTSALRGQGYVVSEDARGPRFTATAGQASDLSPAEVIKIAAEQEGGVQERTKLPICAECQAASPIDAEQCQWCGQPFPEPQ